MAYFYALRDSIIVNKWSLSERTWRERLNSFYFSFIVLASYNLFFVPFTEGRFVLMLSPFSAYRYFLCLIYSVKYMGIIIETYRLSEYFKRLYWNLGILISRNLLSYKSFPPWWKKTYSPEGATVSEPINGFRGCNGWCASSARELDDSLVGRVGLKCSGI